MTFRIIAALCLLSAFPAGLPAQVDDELTSKRRLYPGVGAGLRAVKRGPDGTTCVLATPTPGLLVFDASGKQLFNLGSGTAASSASSSAGTAKPTIVFPEDCDVDAHGQTYVADRGANQVLVLSPSGNLIRSIVVPGPVSVAALPDDEVAVVTFREPHLVTVFGKAGNIVREFGDPEQLSERQELNRFLSVGRIVSDAEGHVDYAFQYFPEPLVRQFDRHGYGSQDISYTALDALPAAQAVRREIERQEKRGTPPSFKRVLTAVGADRTSGEVWMAIGSTLLHFDKDGNRRASYQIYTAEGARLEAISVIVEKERLIVGSDPLGVYEIPRPDLKEREAAKP